MDLDEFERVGPVLTRSQAKQSAGVAIMEQLYSRSEGEKLTEEQTREIFLRNGLWVPPRRLWRMERVPYFRDADDGGRIAPLRVIG